jgi:hypothetical protein
MSKQNLRLILSFAMLLLGAHPAAATPAKCKASVAGSQVFEWPADGSLVSYDKVASYGRKMFLNGLQITRINRNKNVNWSGPSKPQFPYAGDSRTWPERFSAAELRYQQSNYDRDALDEFINVAFNIGVEQGRREVRSSVHSPVVALLTIAETDIRNGRLEAAKDKVASAATLVSQSEIKYAYQGLIKVGSQMEWPTNGMPAKGDELVAPLAAAFHHLYKADTLSSPNSNSIINERIREIIEMGAEQGRRGSEKEIGPNSMALLNLEDAENDISRELARNQRPDARDLERLIRTLDRTIQGLAFLR